MILLDTGPLVASADPAERESARCRKVLERLRSTIVVTTVPVLVESFHILRPASKPSGVVRELVSSGAIKVWWLGDVTLSRAFELMRRYADQPMDLADASLVAAAEDLRTRRIFTLDGDFRAYRIRRGHRHVPFELVG